MNKSLKMKILVFAIACLVFALSIVPVSSLSIKQASSESTIKTINDSSSITTLSDPVHNVETDEGFQRNHRDIFEKPKNFLGFKGSKQSPIMVKK